MPTAFRAIAAEPSGDATLLVVERTVAPPNQRADVKLTDLNMLVNVGGRERTSEEFTALLAGAGFELHAITHLPNSRFIIEVEAKCKPVRNVSCVSNLMSEVSATSP